MKTSKFDFKIIWPLVDWITNLMLKIIIKEANNDKNWDKLKLKHYVLITMRTNLPKTLDQLILVSFTKYLVNALKINKYLVNVTKLAKY